MMIIFQIAINGQDVVLASLLSKPIPLRILDGSTIEFTPEKHGKIPRVYIKTLHDHVLEPPEAQEAAFLCDPDNEPTEVREIKSDHSAFFSATKELHQHLVEIAAKYTWIITTAFILQMSTIVCNTVKITKRSPH